MSTRTRNRSSASLWRNRDWLLLWSGQLVSTAGGRVSLLAFPLLGLAVTGSPAQAGLISAARGIPSTLLALPAGALVDRWDRKRTTLALANAVACAAIPPYMATRLGFP